MKTIQEITIEITQKCNSNCIFCSSLSTKYSENEIPIIKLKEISYFLKAKNASKISISGGEPLLHPDIITYLSFNKLLKIISIIYTSGNVDFLNFLAVLEEKDINPRDIRFIFNYQSADCSVFSEINNTGDCFPLSKINENISLCLKKRFDVEVHIVPNAKNIGSIFETCTYLKNIGVSRVSLLRIVYQGRAEKNRSILITDDIKVLPSIIEKIRAVLCDENFSLRVGIPYSNLMSLKTPCYAGIGKLIIKYDGKVYPCEAFKEAPNKEEYILGDIYANSLESIWNKELISLNKLKSKLKDSTCESCPAQLLYS